MPKQLYGAKKKAKVEEVASSQEQAIIAEQPEIEVKASGEEQVLGEQISEGPVTLVQEALIETTDLVLPSRPVALADLPLDTIIPSRAQARTTENLTPESLEGLVASMKEHGILSRIRVRQVPGNDELFELVFGERRWRAARLAGYTHYPVEIAQYSDDELEEIGLIENIQRQDLTALEEATKYQRLLALQDASGQPKYSIRKLAGSIGKDKSYIEMRLSVLRSTEDVKQLVREQPDVPLRSVYEVSKVDDAEKREEIIAEIREGKLPKVEQVKTRVREATGRVRSSLPTPLPAGPVVVPAPLAATGPQEAKQPVETWASPIEQRPVPLGSIVAPALFDQQLQEDSVVILDIIQRLATTTNVLAAAQREALIEYVDRWGKALLDLKSHAHTQHE